MDLIFQQIVPAYRVPIFREMYKRFDTVLCHSTQNQGSKITSAHEEIDFPNEQIKNNDRFGTSQKVLGVLFKHKPKFVLCGLAATNFTFYKLLFYRFFFRYKLIAWGHIVNNKELDQPFSGNRGKLMKFFLKQANAVVFYSKKRREIACHGLPWLTIKSFVAQNTLDLSEDKIIFEHLKTLGKEQTKKALGENYRFKYNLLFIGRLLPDKGIGLALQAFELLSDETDIALHFIGDGAMREIIEQHALFNKQIFTYGSIYDAQITARHLYVSDLFLMPGYVGLSVVHAFAYGLPVLTCKPTPYGPFHSPEFEYLQHGLNSIICDKTPESIASTALLYFENKETQLSMHANCINTAYNTLQLDNMLNGFQQAISFVYRH